MINKQQSVETSLNISGGEAIARCFKALEVGPMFGMGGFQLLPFYDAARRLGLRHFLINDERAGAFAADAYARVSGRPGLMDATLGPGATNLVSGLTESLNAGIAVIALVGDSAREHSWKNMTQECRQVEILRPAVKEIIRIEHPARIPELVGRAFAVATSGRAGPVVLDVPEDVSHAMCDYQASEFFFGEELTRFPSRRATPARADLLRAVEMIRTAKRPLILAGGGVHISGGVAALAHFATQLQIPIATTMSGKGVIADSNPLSVGLFGRYSRIANDLIEQSDCLLVIGCKLGEIATKRYALLGDHAPIIHLDILPEEFGRTTRPRIALWGDAREGLMALSDSLAKQAQEIRSDRSSYLNEIDKRRQTWRASAEDRYASTESPINMGRLIATLNDLRRTDSIVVADGGFAAHWTGLLYDVPAAGRHYVANRGMASIGYGLPAAIGCQLASPDGIVIAFTGDGGFNMAIGELETAVRLKLPVIIVVLNNAASGYVKALQHAVYGKGNYQSSDLHELDYAKIAHAFGCNAERIDNPDELTAAFKRAFAVRDRPTVLDVVVTRDPAKMLPGVDSRTLKVESGDRPV